MKRYSKLHIEQFDDIYENEFVLPILTSTMPDEVIEYDEINCESYIIDKLNQNYCLLLKIPSFPKEKLLKKTQVLENNNISTLYKIDSSTYDNNIWGLLNAYEYANGYAFFLMKNIDNVKFTIPFSSSERIEISNSTSNKITILRLEMNEIIELLWN